MRNVFCFNGFNQTAIVLRYSVHIKPRKTITAAKTFLDVDTCKIKHMQNIAKKFYSRGMSADLKHFCRCFTVKKFKNILEVK